MCTQHDGNRDQIREHKSVLIKLNSLTSSSYSGHRDACLVGHEAEHGKYHEASKNAGATVYRRHKDRVPEMRQ